MGNMLRPNKGRTEQILSKRRLGCRCPRFHHSLTFCHHATNKRNLGWHYPRLRGPPSCCLAGSTHLHFETRSTLHLFHCYLRPRLPPSYFRRKTVTHGYLGAKLQLFRSQISRHLVVTMHCCCACKSIQSLGHHYCPARPQPKYYHLHSVKGRSLEFHLRLQDSPVVRCPKRHGVAICRKR
jgi:hypothetical protein